MRAGLARAVLLVPAALLVLAAFAMNIYFWYEVMRGQPGAQALYIALSIAAGLLKVGIPVALASAGEKMRDRPGLACVFAVALVFDVLSGLGFSALTRETAMASRSANAAPVAEIRRQLTATQTELAALAGVRLTARVRVELDAARRAAPTCSSQVKARTDACATVAEREAELAEAEARDRLRAEVDRLAQALATAAPETDPDPQLSAIALALRSVGFETDRDTLAKMVGLLLLLLIELGSAVVPRHVLEPRRPPPPPRAPALNFVPKHPRPVPRPRGGADLASILAAPDAIPNARTAADGWIYVSQRDLAAAAGTSAPTIGRRLKAAAAAGVVALRNDNSGSAVKLLQFPVSA